MNPEMTMQDAVRQWQAKHHVENNDPALALVELMGIRLHYFSAPPQKPQSPLDDNFRVTVGKLEGQTKALLDEAQALREHIGFLRQKIEAMQRASIAEQILFIFISAAGGALLHLALQ